MKNRFARMSFLLLTVSVLGFFYGCAGAPDIRAVSKPSESKRQYLGLKKVAVLPFSNIGGEKDAENQIMGIITTELNIKGTFEEIESPRYVRSVLKALKLRNVDELDLEVIQKMGSEMKSQALLFGEIHAWGLGEGDGAAMHVSMTITLMDAQTGKPVWIGSGSKRASFTMSRALGLDEGPTDLGVGRDVIISLIKDMDKEIRQHREAELARIKAEESAKLKAAAEAEKRRLEEIIKQEPEEDN
jgi:hypothetical protein